jgi:protein-S-isoprenylcysteine O-methyltransferase Ste14
MSGNNLGLVHPRSVDAPQISASSDKAATLRLYLVELSIRILTAAVLSLFAWKAIYQWRAAPGRVTLLLLVVAACMTTGLSLFSRIPKQRDWRPLVLLFSIGGTYGFTLYKLAPGVKLAPESIGAALQILGILWQLFAKVSLRRSFGILPANRGVVSRGAYRFVRHPMYLGYLLTDIGFLLTNFGWQNLLVYAVQLGLQVGRIGFEEKILSTDESYRAYKDVVRHRMIPKLF